MRVTVEEVVAEIEQYVCVRAYSTLFCARYSFRNCSLLLRLVDSLRNFRFGLYFRMRSFNFCSVEGHASCIFKSMLRFPESISFRKLLFFLNISFLFCFFIEQMKKWLIYHYKIVSDH